MSDITRKHDLALLSVEHEESVTRRVTRMEFSREITEKGFRLIDQSQVTGFLIGSEELAVAFRVSSGTLSPVKNS